MILCWALRLSLMSMNFGIRTSFPHSNRIRNLNTGANRTRMLFSKFRAELHDILRGTEVAEEVFERLDVLRDDRRYGSLEGLRTTWGMNPSRACGL